MIYNGMPIMYVIPPLALSSVLLQAVSIHLNNLVQGKNDVVDILVQTT